MGPPLGVAGDSATRLQEPGVLNHHQPALGAMGTNPIPLGVGPKADGPPLWGGDTLSRGSRGVIPPAVSLGDPPQMAPVRVFLVGLIELHSTNRTSRESWENTTSQSLVVLEYSSHSRVLLHDYLFTMTTVFFSDSTSRGITSSEV